MTFPISNINAKELIASSQHQINDFTRKYPLVFIVSSVALSSIACSSLLAGTFTGCILGSMFTFIVFNGINHIFSNREDFLELIKLSFASLITNNFDSRQTIEQEAEDIRYEIIQRNS